MSAFAARVYSHAFPRLLELHRLYREVVVETAPGRSMLTQRERQHRRAEAWDAFYRVWRGALRPAAAVKRDAAIKDSSYGDGKGTCYECGCYVLTEEHADSYCPKTFMPWLNLPRAFKSGYGGNALIHNDPR